MVGGQCVREGNCQLDHLFVNNEDVSLMSNFGHWSYYLSYCIAIDTHSEEKRNLSSIVSNFYLLKSPGII